MRLWSLRLLFLLELWSLLLPVFLLKFRFLLLLSLLLLFPLRQQFPLLLSPQPEHLRPGASLTALSAMNFITFWFRGHFIQGLLAEIFHCGLKSLAVHLRKCLAVSILQGYALQLGNLKDNQLVLHIILH